MKPIIIIKTLYIDADLKICANKINIHLVKNFIKGNQVMNFKIK